MLKIIWQEKLKLWVKSKSSKQKNSKNREYLFLIFSKPATFVRPENFLL